MIRMRMDLHRCICKFGFEFHMQLAAISRITCVCVCLAQLQGFAIQ